MLMKLIFTAGLIYVVLFVFKHRARIAAAHKTVMEEKAREAKAQARAQAAQAAADFASRAPGVPVAQDLVPCPKCGAYVAAGATCSCQKA